ncbi:MAG: polyprenol monophosphomannose synthase [Planctomycetota bacterium]
MISYHNRKWKGFQLPPSNNPTHHLPQLSGERTLVALATYNEAGNIVPILNQIRNILPKASILVIDDNSPDGTATQVEKQMASDNSIHLIRRAGKLGLGTALLRAIDYSKQTGSQYLVILDADLSHPVSAIPRLLDGMIDHDIMIGSRYVPGGGTKGWPWSRQIISKGVNLLFQGLFRVRVNDASGSYRCYSVSLLTSTRTDKLISTGYSFLEELLYLCVKAGARVGESPIVFVERARGASKVNWMEAARSLSTLLFLGIRSTLGWDDDLKPTAKS